MSLVLEWLNKLISFDEENEDLKTARAEILNEISLRRGLKERNET